MSGDGHAECPGGVLNAHKGGCVPRNHQ